MTATNGVDGSWNDWKSCCNLYNPVIFFFILPFVNSPAPATVGKPGTRSLKAIKTRMTLRHISNVESFHSSAEKRFQPTALAPNLLPRDARTLQQSLLTVKLPETENEASQSLLRELASRVSPGNL